MPEPTRQERRNGPEVAGTRPLPLNACPELPESTAVLVLTQGSVVTSDCGWAIRLFGACHFVVQPDHRVLGPFRSMTEVFLRFGTVVATCRSGTILRWRGMVMSVDGAGNESGVYCSFDEWVWAEADTVHREDGQPAPEHGTRDPRYPRFVHQWNSIYFVTIDPLPACAQPCATLDEALTRVRSLPPILRRARES